MNHDGLSIGKFHELVRLDFEFLGPVIAAAGTALCVAP
jgi:hypothetical protein